MGAFRVRAPVAPVTIIVNGDSVIAGREDTVASALIASGRWQTRRCPDGEPRGPFCFIGFCQECVAVIDGRRGKRACVTSVADGMRIDLDI